VTDTDDLDALLAALPPYDPREMLREMDEAKRRAAASPPPEQGIIPVPRHVYAPGHRWWWRFLAFECVHGCGWSHVEDLLLNDVEDAARPFVIPAGTKEEMTRAITARADARAEEQRARIENAIREHLRTAHSDHEGVCTLGSRPQLSPPAVGSRVAPPSPLAGPHYVRGES
jgi:hypothetical protein